MRGGLERWKRGMDSHGVRAAIAYALDGECDAHIRVSSGVNALAGYSDVGDRRIIRHTVERGMISSDLLDREQLCAWVDGCDPLTGERRGRTLLSPQADLVLDGTINAPKSFSLVAMLHPELATEFEALQDRLRDRIITTWQRELNARRGAGGQVREALSRVEVVELKHRRSRALDPHVHRHLWLSVKVLGQDGAWSNVDSRVAMRLHTVINAEGELAARTDPEWIAALARHGYTLDPDGEVTQVSQAVRPLSRRSTQIEANRAHLIAQWRQSHPGQEPGPAVLQQIDRHAWKTGRPRKPEELHEDQWESLIRAELAEIDPALLHPRRPVEPPTRREDELDSDLLAARAVVEADARATGSSGRFSVMDVRAGVMRAVAASGLVAARERLQPLIDEVTALALGQVVALLDEGRDSPEHVKSFMAADTAQLKIELAARFEQLSSPGQPADPAWITQMAATVLSADAAVDAGQRDAAGAIAGTDRLVTITGPAGTGKTTMLRIAQRALTAQHRRMVVVAPTRKAATVARREIGADTSSLHAMLADYGWRWTRDSAGAAQWTQLVSGQADPVTGITFTGPRRLLSPGDRIVVDEAGMVDLHTARALAILAEQTGAGIAMVGDPLQAMPVGHAGAMACMTRRSTAVVELTNVHRFHDPDYAALTLRIREPASHEHALLVAAELDDRGHVHQVGDLLQARDVMVEAYFRWSATRHRVALVTGTNDEANAINEAIQQRRLDHGEITATRVAIGQGEQRLLEGDIVQTRRNDAATGVENRALWTIRRTHRDSIELGSLTDPADIRVVSTEYAASHIHLGYASTVHGIQGETTDASIVGPGVDAAGLYVGMTRGRLHNEAIAIARTAAAAREEIASSMTRGLPEVSIDDSITAARGELSRSARTIGPAPESDDASDPRSARISELDAWIHRANSLLTEVSASITTRDAVAHGRTHPTASGDVDAAQQPDLQMLLVEREAELRALTELDDRQLPDDDAHAAPAEIVASVGALGRTASRSITR